MTDTEILDYLGEAAQRQTIARDVQIGSCVFTVGVRSEQRTFREILMMSIAHDKRNQVNRVTELLEGL